MQNFRARKIDGRRNRANFGKRHCCTWRHNFVLSRKLHSHPTCSVSSCTFPETKVRHWWQNSTMVGKFFQWQCCSCSGKPGNRRANESFYLYKLREWDTKIKCLRTQKWSRTFLLLFRRDRRLDVPTVFRSSQICQRRTIQWGSLLARPTYGCERRSCLYRQTINQDRQRGNQSSRSWGIGYHFLKTIFPPLYVFENLSRQYRFIEYLFKYLQYLLIILITFEKSRKMDWVSGRKISSSKKIIFASFFDFQTLRSMHCKLVKW